MAKILGAFRSVVFLGWLSVALASTAIAAGVYALQMTTAVAAMTTKAATTAIKHRKELAKTKAKARLRRAVVAVPIAGVGAIAYFEEQDYQEWLSENPDGSRQKYACEVASLSAEVVDEVLQGLPEWMRPEPEKYMPECSSQ
ncbi:hypothetical protein [Aestuariicoccus sp. MJ-SS9]|uniref:hypothetical protein n=1 Tax=Aestuariicoccus sp. MJ-SS9 TaxID=3079855 RepID=UPI00290F4516|nr:hypothetical protein [Aestuariicoccus sp. MJ-SS9]MDU8913996.1 hypothetical protein [Aestuariicoccus sp. MJ-SS9]